MPVNRVLLAHHDPVVQDAATRALGHIGVTLDIASDNADALSRIAREPYTVIVIERDDAVLAAIGATYREPRPVVIVTTDDRESVGLDAAMVNLVVPPPYDAQTLVGVILASVTPEGAPPSESADGPALEPTH
jgi:DNA-binding response OmpR family regulator